MKDVDKVNVHLHGFKDIQEVRKSNQMLSTEL